MSSCYMYDLKNIQKIKFSVMAIIYEISEDTKKFLKNMPKEIKSLDDVSKIHQKLTEEYDALENKKNKK